MAGLDILLASAKSRGEAMTCQDDLMEFSKEIEQIKKEQKRKRSPKSYLADIEDHRRPGKPIKAKP